MFKVHELECFFDEPAINAGHVREGVNHQLLNKNIPCLAYYLILIVELGIFPHE